MKKYRRAIALFLAIGLMVLIPSGMGVSASGNTVEAKMSENIAQVLDNIITQAFCIYIIFPMTEIIINLANSGAKSPLLGLNRAACYC